MNTNTKTGEIKIVKSEARPVAEARYIFRAVYQNEQDPKRRERLERMISDAADFLRCYGAKYVDENANLVLSDGEKRRLGISDPPPAKETADDQTADGGLA